MNPRIVLYNPKAEYWTKPLALLSLASALARTRFEDVNFQDETFFTDRNRVAGVANRFLELDLGCTWAATMRADQGARLPDEVRRVVAPHTLSNST